MGLTGGSYLVMDKALVTPIRRAFRHFNEGFFHGELNEPKIRINPRKRGIFRFTPEPYALVIGEHFEDAIFREMLDNILHQMCHIRNFQKGVRDRTVNSYHNRKFLDSALKVGLTVIRHKTFGWVTTSYPVSCGEDVFLPTRRNNEKREQIYLSLSESCDKTVFEALKEKLNFDGSVPRKQFFLKYTCSCPPPHNSIRSGRRPESRRRLNAICGDCGEPFKCTE